MILFFMGCIEDGRYLEIDPDLHQDFWERLLLVRGEVVRRPFDFNEPDRPVSPEGQVRETGIGAGLGLPLRDISQDPNTNMRP